MGNRFSEAVGGFWGDQKYEEKFWSFSSVLFQEGNVFKSDPLRPPYHTCKDFKFNICIFVMVNSWT